MHKYFILGVLFIMSILSVSATGIRDLEFYKKQGTIDTTFFYTSIKSANSETIKTSDPYLLQNCGKTVNDSVINGIKLTGHFYFMKYEEKHYCSGLISRPGTMLWLNDDIVDDLISKKYHLSDMINTSLLYEAYSKKGSEALDDKNYYVSLINFLLAAWHANDNQEKGLALYNVAYSSHQYQIENDKALVSSENYVKLSLEYLPNYSKSYNLLGAILEHRGSSINTLNAATMYSKAAEVDQTNHVALYNRARLYPNGVLFKDVYQDAIKIIDKAIYYSPNSPDYYFLRGRYKLILADFFKKKEYFSGAISDFETVIQLGGDVANAYIKLAYIYRLEYEQSEKTDYKLRNTQIQYIREAKAMGSSHADTLATKFDFDLPDYNNRSLTQKEDFAYNNWEILEDYSADINGDGYNDLVILLRLNDDAKIQIEGKELIDNRPRILVIAFFNPQNNRYEVKSVTERFLRNLHSLYAIPDRFKEVRMNNGNLIVAFTNTFSDIDPSYEYTFKYKNNGFFLTNIKKSGIYKKNHKEGLMDFNFETSKAYLKKEDNEISLDFKPKHNFRLEDMKQFWSFNPKTYVDFINITDEELVPYDIPID